MRDGWRKVGPGLYRRGDTWRAVLRFNVRGKIHTLQRTGTGPQSDARKALAAMRVKAHEIRAGSLTVHATIRTFGEALALYQEDHDPGASRCYLDRLTAELGAVPVAELGERFRQWLRLMADARSEATGRPLTAATLNRYAAWARAACNYAVRLGRLPENPLRFIERRRERPRDVLLTPEQAAALVEAVDAKAPYLSAVVRFMLAVPSRIGELRRVKRADVNMLTWTLRVRDTKNGQDVTKPIPQGWLREYVKALPADTEYLFYRRTADGTARPLGGFRKAWLACTTAAKVPGLRVHDLRHHAATQMIHAGIPERVVMAVAGWRSPMLSVYYSRPAEAEIARLAGYEGPNMKVDHEGRELPKAENWRN